MLFQSKIAELTTNFNRRSIETLAVCAVASIAGCLSAQAKLQGLADPHTFFNVLADYAGYVPNPQTIAMAQGAITTAGMAGLTLYALKKPPVPAA